MLGLPSCPEVQDHLTDYLEGSLPFRKRLGIALHLLVCGACRAFRNMLRVLPVFGKGALEPPDTPPPGAEEAFLAALGRIKNQSNQ
jgi:hypothetical protein